MGDNLFEIFIFLVDGIVINNINIVNYYVNGEFEVDGSVEMANNLVMFFGDVKQGVLIVIEVVLFE